MILGQRQTFHLKDSKYKCVLLYKIECFIDTKWFSVFGGGGGGREGGGGFVNELRCVTCASTELCSEIRFYKLK